MVDRIEQEFGINASQALDALARLDKGFDDFNKRIDSTVGRLDYFNKQSGRTVNAMKNVRTGADDMSKGMQGVEKASQGLDNVQKRTRSLAVSWETLTRVVVTQAIVRALNAVRNAFSEGISEAIEFQRQVALIGTIDNSGTSFQDTANGVRELSDAFNIPLLEATEGVYQAISNQVGDFGESLKFTEEAARFATATNSTLADSVDLLSGAMKSYGLDVTDVDRVSGIFFTAIDKGRITADQLANSFGRVGPVAAELGISLEEVSAGIAAISQRGTNTAEAITQFRSSMNALLKPSDAMKAALRELGFVSGQAAIETLGYAGTIDALKESTEGSAEQFSRLFPNVRALSGVTSLLGDELVSFGDALETARNQSRDFNKEKFGQVAATDANKLTKELNRLKNAFTVDLGQTLVESLVSLNEVTGSVEVLVQAIKFIGPAIIPAAASLALLAIRYKVAGTAAGAAALQFSAVNAAITGLALAPLAAGLGASIGRSIENSLTEAALEDVENVQKVYEEANTQLEKTLGEQRDLVKRSVEERVRDVNKAILPLTKAYLSEFEGFESANDALVKSAKNGLKELVDSRKKLVEELEKAALDGEKAIEDSLERTRDIRTDREDRDFEIGISRFDPVRQGSQIIKRAEEIASRAQALFEQGAAIGDPEAIKRAVNEFERAEGLFDRAFDIGGNENNRALQTQARRGLDDLGVDRINLEKELVRLTEDRQAALKREEQIQRDNLSAIEKQAQIIKDNLGTLDDSGNPFSQEELSRRQANRDQAFEALSNLGLSPDQLEGIAALGAQKFVNKFQNDLSANPLELQFSIENQTDQLRQQIQDAVSNFKISLPFDIGELEAAVGRTLNNPEQVTQGLKQVEEEYIAAIERRNKSLTSRAVIPGLREQVDTILAGLDEQIESVATAQTGNSFDLISALSSRGTFNEIVALRSELKALASEADITDEAFQRVIDQRNEAGQALNAGGANRFAFGRSFILLDEGLKRIEQIQNAQVNLEGLDDAKQDVSELGGLLIRMKQEIDQQPQAVRNVVPPINENNNAWESNRQKIEANTRAVQAYNQEVSRSPTPGAGGAEGLMFGGRVNYRAAGGLARGTDQIPAMLSRGETVINAASSRRFFSQIQAINAGQTPAFRENGGTVNNNVGDVNVHITTPVQADERGGRELARTLQRELRRKSIKL